MNNKCIPKKASLYLQWDGTEETLKKFKDLFDPAYIQVEVTPNYERLILNSLKKNFFIKYSDFKVINKNQYLSVSENYLKIISSEQFEYEYKIVHNEDLPGTLYMETETKFGFWDRLKILFGANYKIKQTIKFDLVSNKDLEYHSVVSNVTIGKPKKVKKAYAEFSSNSIEEDYEIN